MLDTKNGQFTDNHNRSVLLRGVNLADSKIPNDQPTQLSDGFYENAENGSVSYTQRPFPAHSLNSHSNRLKSFGYNCIRYVITWESLEHAGPGIYDENFISHTIHTLRTLKSYGFYVYLDPHQDIWSRFVGGSGAPIWTIHACGMQPRHFTSTNAALIHNEWMDGAHDFPDMIWATNYYRLAAYTIFTLFFAGKTYAPRCIIDGVNIQDYLQTHYFNAYHHLAKAIHNAGDLEDSCVLGWDSMNEPSNGLIGYAHIGHLHPEQKVKLGTCPTPYQAFLLGMGHTTTIQDWDFSSLGPKRRHDVTVRPDGVTAWLSEADEPGGKSRWGWTRHPEWQLGRCIWAQHGVWDDGDDGDDGGVSSGNGSGTGRILQPHYFAPTSSHTTSTLFVETFWKEFMHKWAECIRSAHPRAILWIAPPVFEPPCYFDEGMLQRRAVLSHHYYDGLTLMTKDWHCFNADSVGLLRGIYASVLFALKLGERAIRRSFARQLGTLKEDVAAMSTYTYPTMIGEIGIPFDMKSTKPRSAPGVRSHDWLYDYSHQSKAMDVSLGACDDTNCLSYTLWSYVSSNTHEWGDGWNGEDLSVWSLDDVGRNAASSRNTGNNHKVGINHPHDDTSALIPLVETNSNSNSNSNADSSSSSASVTANTDCLDGCRAPESFIRPYLQYTVGVPRSMHYSISQRRFEARVGCGRDEKDASDDSDISDANDVSDSSDANNSNNTPQPNYSTQLFIPRFFFTNPLIQVSEGSYEIVHDKVYWSYDLSNRRDKFITVTELPSPTRPNPPIRSVSQSFIDILSNIITKFIR
ncbi:hypothetical protein E3P94_00084 [Wallemia ichthyophaga]|nr:hypothetical protein E3P95_00084 [Wallemia ichthyophaga]TIB05973.1 hypothetical protein E3P94_00084 [Wallemia ichthyophaga]